ncbi:hypothetical protein [Amaricoccus solimangrovi]|uniref:hypothetical protein n=1 Tax=Amaricoccus solimangrovi TaxID=2589815 RepID=UPI0015E42FAF|nr:hypothetical protein [Amaricoccus solimangrovi]
MSESKDHEARLDRKESQAAAARIGARLRRYHAASPEAPLPPEFVELLTRLERVERLA